MWQYLLNFRWRDMIGAPLPLVPLPLPYEEFSQSDHSFIHEYFHSEVVFQFLLFLFIHITVKCMTIAHFWRLFRSRLVELVGHFWRTQPLLYGTRYMYGGTSSLLYHFSWRHEVLPHFFDLRSLLFDVQYQYHKDLVKGQFASDTVREWNEPYWKATRNLRTTKR